jgi:hypothetical protein
LILAASSTTHQNTALTDQNTFSKEPPTWSQVAKYLGVGLCIVSTTIFTAHLGYCTENNKQKVDYTHLWYDEVPVPQLIFGLNVSFKWKM